MAPNWKVWLAETVAFVASAIKARVVIRKYRIFPLSHLKVMVEDTVKPLCWAEELSSLVRPLKPPPTSNRKLNVELAHPTRAERVAAA